MNINTGSLQRTDRLGRAAASALLVLGLFSVAACKGGGGGGSDAAVPTQGSALSAVSPAVGSALGGTLVTITGSDFVQGVTGSTTVTFGGVAATSVVVVDDTTLTCESPAGTPGMNVTVRVANSHGTGLLAAAFRYLPLPEVFSDLNGDGKADIAIGAPRADTTGADAGEVYVYLGGGQAAPLVDATAAGAAMSVAGGLPSCNFGKALVTGDLDGDGWDDLIVGADLDDTAATDAGAVYVFWGPVVGGGAVTASDADVVLLGDGTVAGDRFGSALALGDVDGDGKTDLVVSAARHDTNAGTANEVENAGAVYVFLDGSKLTDRGAAQADLVYSGDGAGSRLGNQVMVRDLNGDGIDDLVAASSLADPILPPKRTDAGAVYVWWGGASIASGPALGADVVLTGEKNDDQFGDAIAAGDLDGDGVNDLVVGVPLQDPLGANVGSVYVFRGGPGLASRNAAAADFRLDGQPTHDAFGDDVATGDVDADGFVDLVVGASRASYLAIGNGRTYVFRGGPSFGNRVASQADMIVTGEPVASEGFGGCARTVDLDHDGLADVMASAPGNDAGGPGAGRVYMFFGAQYLANRFATQDDVTFTGSDPGGQFGAAILHSP